MTVIRIGEMEFRVDDRKVSSPYKEWNRRLELTYVPDSTGLLSPEWIIVSMAKYYYKAIIVSGDVLLTLNNPKDTVY